MPDNRRAYVPGGTFFFTLVTENRAPIFSSPQARLLLRETMAFCRQRRPFSLDAIVLLPDHLHTIWTLPPEDADFSTRWAYIKAAFSRRWVTDGGKEQPVSASRLDEGRRGIWQRRFWEHAIADERDFNQHADYIHHNPVKHGLVQCPHDWEYSSFSRWVQSGSYPREWQCRCDAKAVSALVMDREVPEPLEGYDLASRELAE